MNRKLSKIFAWSALAILIIVPSSDILTSKPINNFGDIAKYERLNKPTFQEIGRRAKLDSEPLAFGSEAPKNLNKDEVSSKSEEIASQQITMTKQGVRIVGDVGMATNISNVRLAIQNRLTKKELYLSDSNASPIIKNIEQETAIALTPPVLVANIEMPELEEILEKTTSTAPIPMPRLVRATKNTVATAQVATKVKQIAQARKITKTSNQHGLYKVDFYDLVASRANKQDDNLQLVVQQPNRQRLDRVNQRTPANQSEFFLVWQNQQRTQGFRQTGSFVEQLPARRGSGIRLDLIKR